MKWNPPSTLRFHAAALRRATAPPRKARRPAAPFHATRPRSVYGTRFVPWRCSLDDPGDCLSFVGWTVSRWHARHISSRRPRLRTGITTIPSGVFKLEPAGRHPPSPHALKQQQATHSRSPLLLAAKSAPARGDGHGHRSSGIVDALLRRPPHSATNHQAVRRPAACVEPRLTRQPRLPGAFGGAIPCVPLRASCERRRRPARVRISVRAGAGGRPPSHRQDPRAGAVHSPGAACPGGAVMPAPLAPRRAARRSRA